MEKVINLKRVFESEQCKEYHRLSKELSEYYKINQCESTALNRKYNKALDEYRKYLRMNGITLPAPKYPIIEENENTLKYSDVIVRELVGGGCEYVCMLHNPKWIYKQKEKDDRHERNR